LLLRPRKFFIRNPALYVPPSYARTPRQVRYSESDRTYAASRCSLESSDRRRSMATAPCVTTARPPDASARPTSPARTPLGWAATNPTTCPSHGPPSNPPAATSSPAAPPSTRANPPATPPGRRPRRDHPHARRAGCLQHVRRRVAQARPGRGDPRRGHGQEEPRVGREDEDRPVADAAGRSHLPLS